VHRIGEGDLGSRPHRHRGRRCGSRWYVAVPRFHSFRQGWRSCAAILFKGDTDGLAALGCAASGENAAAAEREAKIDALLLWGGKQEERRLTLASKLKWESYDSQGLDTTHLTDRQAEERLAYERCGFIFAMYHADTWYCEVADLGRKLVLVRADKALI
jgi:hypothetical protein